MAAGLNLERHGIRVSRVFHNAAPGVLYEIAVCKEGAAIVRSGALAMRSGAKTGRSPRDKRIVRTPATEHEIWWGDVNIPLDPNSFRINRQRAIDFLNTRDYLYVVDGYAGWSERSRVKVRVICSLAYHALFMHNMLIRPSRDELAQYGDPDFVIFNAGGFPANPFTAGMSSPTSIDLNVDDGELVILGTLYAGEMKKGVFTLMNYLMPKRGILSMHCSANEGAAGDVALFFGLSGTGKTTLSADPARRLIGDDEHCWDDEGIFNIEGGCYAKCAGLSLEKEPQIFDAIRFGTVLENVVFDPDSREVDYNDLSITENTRAAYAVDVVANAKIPAIGGHPRNIILLTCDAFGILPPVSRLTPAQAMYHFISGYTAKVAGTEMGITEPQATFSACFGAAFLMWHPAHHARMLAERISRHKARVWLVNTGWSGGAFGIGKRIDLRATRAIIAAIHTGALDEVASIADPFFGLAVPSQCPGVPAEILFPQSAWPSGDAYSETARKLATLFKNNFGRYAAEAGEDVRAAGPRL